MIDPTACATWGAEIRSIIITATIAIAALAAFCAALSIGWTRAIGSYLRRPDLEDAESPTPTRPRPRRRFSLVDHADPH